MKLNNKLLKQRRQTKPLVKRRIKKACRDMCPTLKNDVNGRQNIFYKIIKPLNKVGNNTANLELLKRKDCCRNRDWIGFYTGSGIMVMKKIIGKSQEIDCIEDEDLEEALRQNNNKKASGAVIINKELYKYLSTQSKYRCLEIINQCWR